jgi:hypothetical protein
LIITTHICSIQHILIHTCLKLLIHHHLLH